MEQSLEKRLKAWQRAVKNRLQNPALPGEPPYLINPMNYALDHQGKMLRSALCLASAEAVGGKWEVALDIASAIEIFHTFTLVHDDIMDGDELRRGVETVHKKYGTDRALLAGDTLLIYVYQIIARSSPDKLSVVLEAFNSGAMDVCLGQGWDMEFEAKRNVSPQQYEMMIDHKTGALVRLSCKLGGIIAGGSDRQVSALSRFGLLLGRAFQMQDDLLEMSSTVAEMGKSLGSDLLNEKKTWIWLDLKKNLSPEESQRWESIRRSGSLANDDRQRLHHWMEKYGTIERAEALIASWIAEAGDILQGSDFVQTEMLAALSNLILTRKK